MYNKKKVVAFRLKCNKFEFEITNLRTDVEEGWVSLVHLQAH